MYNIKNYILIIIFILIIYFIFIKSNNNSNITTNKINEKIFINTKTKKNINLKENNNQIVTTRLINLFKTFSNTKKYKLYNLCNKVIYQPSTTDIFVKAELDSITKIILKNLNNKKFFNFTQVNYEDITELIDKKGNSNIIYSLFLQENNFLFNIEVKINVIKFINSNEVKKRNILTCTELTTPEFSKYNIGIPSLNQLIPLPTEVITTSGDVLNTKGINVPTLKKIKYLYINEINIVNSTLVLYPFNKCIKENYNKNTDKTLPHTWVDNNNNPIIECAYKRNKWPTLNSQPKKQKAWPCTLISQDWNDEGIYVPQVTPTNLCPGLRSSTKEQPLTGEYWPTLATIPRNMGPNKWLFDLSRGIPQFNT